ncbi:NAD(P)H-dependent oxidoreductase [Shewanella atlantica]|uniref:NAD(P)H-dependent oxidoreductase n=1 Tax=Shewanella atlantica TaxID=271099 RepID=UPI0037355921
MSKIVVISGHPNLKESMANSKIINILSTLDKIHIRCLDELYPDYNIDIPTEQSALQSADLIIFQFPLYWSTYPAIMKKWFDDVFTYNFAFGPEGDKLKGKKVILSITAGATAESYNEGDFNFMPLDKYLESALHPLKAAQVDLVDNIVTFNMNSDVNEGGNVDTVNRLVIEHADRVKAAISNTLNG